MRFSVMVLVFGFFVGRHFVVTFGAGASARVYSNIVLFPSFRRTRIEIRATVVDPVRVVQPVTEGIVREHGFVRITQKAYVLLVDPFREEFVENSHFRYHVAFLELHAVRNRLSIDRRFGEVFMLAVVGVLNFLEFVVVFRFAGPRRFRRLLNFFLFSVCVAVIVR